MAETDTITQRLVFLEREFDRLGRSADDVEHDLLCNPTDQDSLRRLQAIYVLTGETWDQIRALRARQPGQHGTIRYDREADLADQAWRRALC